MEWELEEEEDLFLEDQTNWSWGGNTVYFYSQSPGMRAYGFLGQQNNRDG